MNLVMADSDHTPPSLWGKRTCIYPHTVVKEREGGREGGREGEKERMGRKGWERERDHTGSIPYKEHWKACWGTE